MQLIPASLVPGGPLGTPSSGTLTNCTGYPAASDTVAGVAEIATQAEMETATDTSRIASPGRIQYHPGVAKAWVNFDGTGTVSVRASYNLDGSTPITDNGTGNYTVNLGTDMSSANFCAVQACRMNSVGVNAQVDLNAHPGSGASWTIRTIYWSASANFVIDNPEVCMAFFGDQ